MFPKRPLSITETQFESMQTRCDFSGKHKGILSVCDQENVVLVEFYEVILYSFMWRALNPAENTTVR